MQVGELWVLFGLQPTKGWGEATKLLEGVKRAAMAVVTGQGIRAIAGLVTHATEAATHLVSMSQAMALTVEQTQEWGYVAEQSGSNLKELSVGFNMFLRNLQQYSQGKGSKNFAAHMRDLGVSATQAQLSFTTKDGFQNVLLKVSDGLHGMGNAAAKATHTLLFGARAGRAALADMSRGSDTLKEMFARRREFGELSGAEALKLRDLGNRAKDLKTSFGALASSVIAKLAPTFLEMADGALRWLSANKELVGGALTAALEAVAAVFGTIGEAVREVSDIIHRAFAGDEGAQATLIGLAAIIAAVVIPALWAMVFPIAAAAAPFIAIGIAVGLVAYGIMQLVKHAREIGGAFARPFISAWNSIKETFEDIGSWVMGVGDTIVNAFHNAWDLVKKEAVAAIQWISDKAREIPVLGWIGEKIGQGAGYIHNKITGDKHLDGIDVMNDAPPAVNASSAARAGGNSTTTVGPTSVQINVASVKEAKQAYDDFKDDQNDNRLRHAARSTGGNIV